LHFANYTAGKIKTKIFDSFIILHTPKTMAASGGFAMTKFCYNSGGGVELEAKIKLYIYKMKEE